MHYQRFFGGTTSICKDSEAIAHLLNRKWFLARPDTKIQPVLISGNPECNDLQHLHFSTHPDTDFRLAYGRVFHVIRDDLLHPLMGGNKLRKLDALLPLLQSISVTDVITCGGSQSAHTAALAVACAETGLRAHLLLRGEKLSVPTGYNLISGMYGEVTYIPRSEYADRETMLTKYAKRLAESGPVVRMEGMHADFDASAFKGKLNGSCQPSKKVAIVNEGASDAIALLGLVRLIDYLSHPNFFGRDRKLQLVVDCGTGTTAIGLALAISILRLPWEVVGVMLVGGVEDFRKLGARLLHDFNKMWIQDTSFEIMQAGLEDCLKWTDRPRPRKFGKVLEGEIHACQKIAKETGVLLDPVYTLAAWEVASNLTLSRDTEIVMLHTGGTMGLFGLAQRYSSEFNVKTSGIRSI